MERNLKTYFDYTDKLGELAKDGYYIVKGLSPLDNLQNYGIDQGEEKEILGFLKKSIHLFDGSGDGDDGARRLSLSEAIDMEFPVKEHFLSVLRDIIKKDTSLPKKIRAALMKLYAAAEDAIEVSENSHEKTVSLPPVVKESVTYQFIRDEVPRPIIKIFQLRKFFFNRAKDPEYFPTTPVQIETSEFDQCSREELVSTYSPENFYKLGGDQIKSLLQATANEYLTQNGVAPCAVVFEPLKTSSKAIQFGEYDPNRGVVVINSNIVDNLDAMREAGNEVYPYQLMSTIIHECRHRVQFDKLDKNDQSEVSRAISKSLYEPQDCLSHSDYLAEPDEVDARNAALEYVMEEAKNSQSESLKAFYNLQKKLEQTNGKKEISESLKPSFRQIYSNETLQSKMNLERARREMFDIAVSSAAEPTS